MSERIYLWDNIKVCLMLFVIMTHSVCVYQYYNNGEQWIEFYWVFIMTYTMPLFTMVSGYWFRKKSIKQAFKRFLWPCLLFSIVNFMWGGLFYPPYKEGGLVSYLSLGYAMWFLWALFIYYLLTPILLRHIKLYILLFVSFIVALASGFIDIIGNLLQLSRVICFYPFFIFGIMLKENDKYLHTISRGYKWFLGLLALSLLYIVADKSFPSIVYQTGFTGGFGISLSGLALRVFTYMMCFAMSICFIFVMPNRKLWFSKYGSRTMNVYVLHMLIIFPCTWYLGPKIMNHWYGYLFLIIGVPVLRLPLFSKYIDSFMKKVLLLDK